MAPESEDPAVQGGAPEGSGVESGVPENSRCSFDPQPVHVELSERRRRSGDTVPVAACDLAEVESLSSPICKLARKLVALGIDPDTHLTIWRGSVRCFHDLPISVWAGLVVEESGSGPVFKRYKPFPDRAVASQRRESDG